MSAPIDRPDPSRFDDVPFAIAHPARFVDWDAPGLDGTLRIAVVDELPSGPPRGTFLLLHGEPSWSLLYERWIPRLVAAGFRCLAVDLPGFGRSDHPTDDSWYSYERHVAAVAHVLDELDPVDVHLVVQDWAGPIGLRQLVDRPDRFVRAFVLNTWLHHAGFEYSDGIRWWRSAAVDPTQLGGDMPTGRIVAGTMRRSDHDLARVEAQFDAPFAGPASKAGARAFPTMLPFAEPERGGAAEQERCRTALRAWTHCPIHLAFGDADPVFTFEQASQWAQEIPGATLDRIVGAGHFVQYDAPDDCLEVIGRRLGVAL